MGEQQLKFRRAEKNDTDALLYKKCFDENESPKSIVKIKWLLFNNEKLWIQFAVAETPAEKVAAILATIPLKMKYFDKLIYSGQFIDTMTDKEFRGKGLFAKLSGQSYETLKEENCEIGWGFPNINAAHGWFNKFGWTEIADVPFIFKPLRTGYFKTKIKSVLKFLIPNISIYRNKKIHLPNGFTLSDITLFDSQFDLLWQNFSMDIPISIARDSKYLNWRYIAKPEEHYSIKAIKNDSNGRIEAFIVYCLKEKHGGKIGYIMELISNSDSDKMAVTLLKYALNDLQNRKGDIILAWCFDHSPNYKAYKAVSFMKLPKKLQFIKMFFGGIKLLNVDDKRMFEKRNWYLSYSDSDTV